MKFSNFLKVIGLGSSVGSAEACKTDLPDHRPAMTTEEFQNTAESVQDEMNDLNLQLERMKLASEALLEKNRISQTGVGAISEDSRERLVEMQKFLEDERAKDDEVERELHADQLGGELHKSKK